MYRSQNVHRYARSARIDLDKPVNQYMYNVDFSSLPGQPRAPQPRVLLRVKIIILSRSYNLGILVDLLLEWEEAMAWARVMHLPGVAELWQDVAVYQEGVGEGLIWLEYQRDLALLLQFPINLHQALQSLNFCHMNKRLENSC
jgi:hypothetical protein